MDIKDVLSDFFTRIDTLIENNKSYYILAFEVAIYEIFSIIIKQLLITKQPFTIDLLLDFISVDDNGFLLQIIGLPHLSKPYMNLSPVTKTDIGMLKSFVVSNYGEICSVEDDKIKLSEKYPWKLDDYFQFKFEIDLKLIKKCCEMTIFEIDNQIIDALDNDYYSKLVDKARAQRDKLGRIYICSFIEKCHKEKFNQDDYDLLDKTLDKQIMHREMLIKRLQSKLSKDNKDYMKNFKPEVKKVDDKKADDKKVDNNKPKAKEKKEAK